MTVLIKEASVKSVALKATHGLRLLVRYSALLQDVYSSHQRLNCYLVLFVVSLISMGTVLG